MCKGIKCSLLGFEIGRSDIPPPYFVLCISHTSAYSDGFPKIFIHNCSPVTEMIPSKQDYKAVPFKTFQMVTHCLIFLNVGTNLISSRTSQNLFTFVQYYFRQCHSGQAEENFGQLTIFLVRFVHNKSFDNIKLVGNALWAWALAFTFFMSFEGSSYWFVYPNRGRIFLRENSNGLKVSRKCMETKGFRSKKSCNAVYCNNMVWKSEIRCMRETTAVPQRDHTKIFILTISSRVVFQNGDSPF